MKKLLGLVLSAVMLTAMAVPVMAEEAALPSVTSSRVDGFTEAAPAPATQEEAYNVNPLTGIADLDDSAIGKRPAAVMINNHPDNYPQYNISKADVLYEVVVEHDLSRMLALFADYQKVPYLVSVRSYRYYFPQISQGYDAYYIHWGEDQTMMDYYYELGLDSYDGLSNEFLFGRDQGRLDRGYSLEHTSCFYGERLPQQLEADGKRTELKDEYKGLAFNFVPAGTTRVPEGDDCNFVYVNYGNQTTQITYDADSHKYLKYALEEPQMDGITDSQLQFDNVFVLYTRISDREDDEVANRKWLDVIATADDDFNVGYYLTEGKIEPIKWVKEDVASRMKFYNAANEEIQINRGKTYITITYNDSATFSTDIPEGYR